MPKIVELTVEIDIQRVSCPGVWLCQDGRVSLTVFALGTSYQTCLLPPIFPLMFKDIFYFRKRFENSCAMNNMCCLLKDENIYCELVQWCEECNSGECIILAQYLGALNDILFPPNMCSNDGVDLLMRRTKAFPGILSPKIEIATKVRIDEVWNHSCNVTIKPPCACSQSEADGSRQRQVCHSAQYHRKKCSTGRHPPAVSRSRSRSGGSRSCCSLVPPDPPCHLEYRCPPSVPKSRRRTCRPPPRPHNCLKPQYNVYNVEVEDSVWTRKYENPNYNAKNVDINSDDESRSSSDTDKTPYEDRQPTYEDRQKTIIESRYIEEDSSDKRERRRINRPKLTPCVCQICKRYHELFHTDLESS